MVENGKQPRRVNGHLHLPGLRAAVWSRLLVTRLFVEGLPDPRHHVRWRDLGG